MESVDRKALGLLKQKFSAEHRTIEVDGRWRRVRLLSSFATSFHRVGVRMHFASMLFECIYSTLRL